MELDGLPASCLVVAAAGFVGFFVMLAYTAGFLIWFACASPAIGFLLLALFSMVMWCPRTMHTAFSDDVEILRLRRRGFAVMRHVVLPGTVKLWMARGCKGRNGEISSACVVGLG